MLVIYFLEQNLLSVEKCRQLEPSLKELSDEEILEIVENYYEMGQLATEDFKDNKKGSKNP